jgi:hypothetical protein
MELIRYAAIVAVLMAQGPPPRMPEWARDRPYFTSATQIASPAVVATWMKRVHNEVETLQLLVLWRGRPGWFISGGHRASAGGTGDTWWASAEYAGVPLSVTFDAMTRVAEIQGRRMTLAKDVNVLLVDGVDGPAPALTISMAYVDPATPTPGNPLPPLLRQSDRLVEFLQCHLTVPQVSVQKALDMLCAQVKGGG